jgi:hypothetical protein
MSDRPDPGNFSEMRCPVMRKAWVQVITKFRRLPQALQ